MHLSFHFTNAEFAASLVFFHQEIQGVFVQISPSSGTTAFVVALDDRSGSVPCLRIAES